VEGHATLGFSRSRTSFFHIPIEVLQLLIVPAERSRIAKLISGDRTTPLAGVTRPKVHTWSLVMISSTSSGHIVMGAPLGSEGRHVRSSPWIA
jgi:hypothetical protein